MYAHNRIIYARTPGITVFVARLYGYVGKNDSKAGMGKSARPYTWLRMRLRKKLSVLSTIPRSGASLLRYAVPFLGHSPDGTLRNFVWPTAKNLGDFLPQAQHIAAA